MKYILLFSLTLLSLTTLTTLQSCEKEIPFDAEVSEPKLVLNSLFTSDSVWRVHVSRSLSVLDTGQLDPVTDAMLTISDGSGNPVATLQHLGIGLYESSTAMPSPDQSYRIDASAPGYEPVYAVDEIPGTVQIISLDTFYRYDPDSNLTIDFELTFADPTGARNFYMVDLLASYTYVFGTDTIFDSYPAYVQCTDPNIETDNGFSGLGFENYYEYILLKDLAFDGQNYTLRFTVEDLFRDPFAESRLTLSLVTSSEAFFNYRRSYSAFRNTQGDPFAQPVQVYSNVEGGHGIFAGGARQVWEIEY